MSRSPRFTDTVPVWEATPAETARVFAARDRLVLARRLRANAEAIEQEALTWAAEVAQAQIDRCRAGAGDDGSGGYLFPVRAIAAELGAAVRESSQAMQRKMLCAVTLTTRFPAVTAAVSDGRVSGRCAAVIAEHGERVPDGDLLADYQARAVAFAEEASLGQTRVFVKTLAAALVPESLTDRHERARKLFQGVFVRDLEDGMAELTIIAPATVIHGAHDRLTAMGYAIKRERSRRERHAAAGASAGTRAGGGQPVIDEDGYARHPEHDAGTRERTGTTTRVATDTRVVPGAAADLSPGTPADAAVAPGTDTASSSKTHPDADAVAPREDQGPALRADTRNLAELRADLAIDLLLSGLPTAHAVCDGTGRNALDAITATVNVTIPATTLTGEDDGDHGRDAFLAGYGPIDPDTARRLAGNTPGWDRLFRNPDTGILLTVDRYTPTPAQRRFLTARDETCRFPYCDVLARRADIDHTVAWQQGGSTTVRNLAALCEAHHMDKHHTPWTVTQHPDGILEWTSPLGTTHTDTPQPATRAARLREAHRPGGGARHESPPDAPDQPPF